MRGLKLRAGKERRQNKALTLAKVNALDDLISQKRQEVTDETERERLEELMCYVMISFTAGFVARRCP